MCHNAYQTQFPTPDHQEKSVILVVVWHTPTQLLIPPEYGWLLGYKDKTVKMLIDKPMEENPSKNRTEALAAIQTGCSLIRMYTFKTDSIEAKSEYIALILEKIAIIRHESLYFQIKSQ